MSASSIIFVTGTDTGVGKTYTSSLLARTALDQGINVGVLKPIETGCEVVDGKHISRDGLLLQKAVRKRQTLEEINPFRFFLPAAPTVAMEAEQRFVSFEQIVGKVESAQKSYDLLIVEGAGGLLVPLAEDKSFADLASLLKMHVVLVIGSRLGCINHAALTFEVLLNRSIPVLGYVLNEVDPSLEDYLLRSNRTSIEMLQRKYGYPEFCYLANGKDLPANDQAMKVAVEKLKLQLLTR